MRILVEFAATDLVRNSTRKPTESYTIRYSGLNPRFKILFFNVGDYEQRLKLDSFDTVKNWDGTLSDKIKLVLDDDVSVSCTCPDWSYGGFKYMGTQLGYSLTPEVRIPKRNNPNLDGSVCKHLTHLLKNIDNYVDEIANDLGRYTGFANIKKETMAKSIADQLIESKLSEETDMISKIENWDTENVPNMTADQQYKIQTIYKKYDYDSKYDGKGAISRWLSASGMSSDKLGNLFKELTSIK